MNGRTEHSIKIDNRTKKILEELPASVENYYYSICSSTEPHTRMVYMNAIRSFLEYTKKSVFVIDDTDIAKYFIYINERSQNKKGEALSSSYQQMVWSALNGLFEYLKERGNIDKNPVRLYKYPKTHKKAKGDFLSIEEINNTLEATKGEYLTGIKKTWHETFAERDALIMYILSSTGMRSEMLCELNINDLDIKNKKIKTIAKGGKVLEYEITTKMGVYLSKWLIKRTALLDGSTSDALFINRYKRRLSYNSLRDIVKKYTAQSGKTVSPHRLRASFITNYYEMSGHDLEATKIAAGHENSSTTERYICGKENSRFKAQRCMDDLIG